MPSNLNPAERLWYQLRTARYMEDFYNTNPHEGGLFQDSIKEEVYDVDVKVIVTDQVVVDGGDDSGGRNDIDDVLYKSSVKKIMPDTGWLYSNLFCTQYQHSCN